MTQRSSGEVTPNPSFQRTRLRRPLNQTLGLTQHTMAEPQLIVQLPFDGADDYDRLIAVEESLINAFAQRNPFAEVDGHDMGQGRFNIFIRPMGTWGPVLERVEVVLKLRGVLPQALIVKRLKSEKYVVVWPKRHLGAFAL